MGAEFSDLAGAFRQKRENEGISKAVCARLNTAAFTDGLGRVRIADGAGRAMVAKSERDRIRDLDLTPLCLLTLDNFEDDVHHNKCRSIFLGCDHDAEEDGEKVFLHYIVRLDQQHAGECTCPKFCSLHGMGPMMSSKVSRIAGIEHDAYCIKDNMRFLIQQRIFDPFKENKVFILSDQDRYALVGQIDNAYRKVEAFRFWINDYLPRDAELVRPQAHLPPALQSPAPPSETPQAVMVMSYGFDDMMQRYKKKMEIGEGSFYDRLSADRCECTASPAKKPKLDC